MYAGMLFTFENLRDKVWSDEVHRGDDAIEAAIKRVVWPAEMHAMPWAEAVMNVGEHQTLRNRSDVLMGFELDESADERVMVNVGVGKNTSYLAILTPGVFVPALKGVHCLPTLPLAYDEIRLSCTGDSSKLRVVQAVLSRETRIEIANGRKGLLLQFDHGYHVIKGGRCQECVPGQHPMDDPTLLSIPRINL